MKKFFALLLAACSLFLVSSCEPWDENPRDREREYEGVPKVYRSFDTAVKYLIQTKNNRPSIVHYTTMGKTVEGRDIPAVIVTKNPTEPQGDKPGVRIAGSIHGNEYISGEVVFRFIEYLTNEYKAGNSEIVKIVDNNYIVCMPILNPDGHERGSRYNANWEDLNRDFVIYGAGGSGISLFTQPETQAVRDFPAIFHISVTFHSGEVVINLPFDYATRLSKGYAPRAVPASNDLVWDLGNVYANAGFSSNPDVLLSSYAVNGVITGGDWYAIDGSLQDWSYLQTGCIDMTVEVSRNYSPQTEEGIQAVFDYNKKSLVEFIKQASYVKTTGVTSAAEPVLDPETQDP